MSKLTKLVANPITIEIGEVELKIYPLTMKHMPIMMAAGSKDESKQAEAFMQMIEITLKKAVPDATQEELDGFSMKHFQELSSAIMEVNGLKQG